MVICFLDALKKNFEEEINGMKKKTVEVLQQTTDLRNKTEK